MAPRPRTILATPRARPAPDRLLRPAHGVDRPRRLRLPALVTAVWVASTVAGSCDVFEARGDDRRRIVEAAGPELAVEWADLAYDIAYGEDQFLTFKGQRAIAMMHLAMHDALQAVVPVYSAYAFDAREPDADPVAAATAAAHEVLLAAYPDRQAALDSARTRWLDRAPEGPSRTGGMELGFAAARAILERRDGDGWDAEGTYHFRSGSGEYQTTPPWDGFTLQPGFGSATPFSFDEPDGFRSPPPPALDSPEYAAALNEVREQGDSTSAARTGDQTGYAVWWMEYSESAVGRVARRLARERELDLWQANRMLAHLYMALFDAYVSSWDSKYEYNHWRPYTAIRAADTDGNEATAADPDWVPLRPTPPFPEYTSAHAVGCGAAYEVMGATFGDATAFENTSLTAPADMPTRSFPSFRAAAEECADSRVRLGWHFRYATDEGLQVGRAVARHVMTSTLVPR